MDANKKGMIRAQRLIAFESLMYPEAHRASHLRLFAFQTLISLGYWRAARKKTPPVERTGGANANVPTRSYFGTSARPVTVRLAVAVLV